MVERQAPPPSRQIGFDTLKDITGYLHVDDGNVLHVRVHIQRVGKTDQKDQDGFPVYVVQNNVTMSVMTEEDYENMTRTKKGYIPK